MNQFWDHGLLTDRLMNEQSQIHRTLLLAQLSNELSLGENWPVPRGCARFFWACNHNHPQPFTTT